MRGRWENIAGKKFGKWTVLEEDFSPKDSKRGYWLCRCECGTIKRVLNSTLKQGNSTKCKNCLRIFVDLSGKKFGKLTAIKHLPDHPLKSHDAFWECQCECGSVVCVGKTSLIKGKRLRCRKCTYEDLTGKRFGNQTVIKRDHTNRKWLVRCDCGEEKLKKSQCVKISNSCGRCESKQHIGKKFGKLTIIRIIGHSSKKNAIFELQCDCGEIKNMRIHNLLSGRVRSCGCLRNENRIKNASSLIGKKIGYWKIEKIFGYEEGKQRIIFTLKCKCGKRRNVKRTRLGSSKSCGCSSYEKYPRGEEHHWAKLKNEEANSIRELINLRVYSKKELSNIFNVSEGVISRIIKKQTYI